jgi:butyryl-CoA dehydrogenase
MARVYTAEAFARIEQNAQRVLAAAAEGDTLRVRLTILRRLAKRDPANTIGLKREIAAHVIAAGKYSL